MGNQLLHLFHLAATNCTTNNGFVPSLYDGLTCTDGVPDITQVSDAAVFVGNIVRILIAVSGALAVITILVSAIYYITSTGDPGRVKRAKEILINTTIGLVLIIVAYTLVTYIAGEF